MSPVWMDEEIRGKIDRERLVERLRGKVDLQLGKNGLTKGFIEEVKNRLRKHGVVKIRVLKTYVKTSGLDRRAVAEKVAETVGAKLIDVRGYTFILVREKVKERS